MKHCHLTVGEHVCHLINCPKDDPDHMHICWANDYDWTDGEHHKMRLGLITEEQLNNTASDRADRRCMRGGPTAVDLLDQSIRVWRQVSKEAAPHEQSR